MIIIADTHGDFSWYSKVILDATKAGRSTMHLGDLGLGFPQVDRQERLFDVNAKDLSEMHRFIRGNHDKPLNSRANPMSLGDYGFIPSHNIFFLAGGYSIDWQWRKEGVSWWKDEEVSQENMDQAFRLYGEVKPEIVFSHECPDDFTKILHGDCRFSSRTSRVLNDMLSVHVPKKWYFGHHHRSWKNTYFGCQIRCVNIREVVEDKEIRNFTSDMEIIRKDD